MVNIEAAQNRVNIQEQIKLTEILNKKFGVKFIRKNEGPKPKEGNICHLNLNREI